NSARPFVSHWTNGTPEDVAIPCQVVSTDPIYGFQRVCDQTPSIRVFEERLGGAFVDRNQTIATTPSLFEEDLGKEVIEIGGKCFNAFVAIETYGAMSMVPRSVECDRDRAKGK
ncbi:hypothetical protein GCK32_013370, partial [Trichostrongylus colubriformis]